MQERASSLGGKLEIKSNIKRGTIVDLVLPHTENESDILYD